MLAFISIYFGAKTLTLLFLLKVGAYLEDCPHGLGDYPHGSELELCPPIFCPLSGLIQINACLMRNYKMKKNSG